MPCQPRGHIAVPCLDFRVLDPSFRNIFALFLSGSGFVLLSAIADIIIGIIFLANQVFVAAAIPFVFAAWILFAGMLAVIHAFDFKRAGFINWYLLLIFGILTVLFAVLSFVDPAISAFTITFMVGFALITRGVNRFIFLAGIKNLL